MFKDIKKFFTDFINGMRGKRGFKYAPFIAIPCLLAILLPTIFAVWHVYLKDDQLFDAHDVSVTLYNNEGKMIASETVTETYVSTSPLTSIFYAMNSGKEFSTRPEDCIDEANYRVTIDSGDSYVDYDCYFSSSPTSSYIYYAEKYFSVSEEPYTRFLRSGYSEGAYPSATPPALLTKQGESIIPDQVYWRYKNSEGEFKQAKYADVTTRLQNFEMSGSIAFEFERLPSACTVKVSDSEGNLLYSGDLDRLSFITAEPGTLLHVDITASWARTEECLAYGMLDYSFTVICKDHASFEISTSTICPGEFILLSGSDIEPGTKVIYSPAPTDDEDPDLKEDAESGEASEENTVVNDTDIPTTQSVMAAISPTVSYSGSNAYALLPIPYGTPAGSFSFTLSGGAASKKFTVTVTDAPAKDEVTLTKSKKVINNAISSAALAELDRVMSDVLLKSTDAMLFRGEFASFDNGDFTRGFSYGDRFIIGGELNEKFAAMGNEYVTAADQDSSVHSLNIGRVVYVGYILHLGNFVVVDHGMGIATWYCHLSSFDCAVGDVLAKGEAVGKSGGSVFLEDSGTLLMCSLGGQFIDPDLISGNELFKKETQVSGGTSNDVQ